MGSTYLDSLAAFSSPSENPNMKYLDSIGEWSIPEGSHNGGGGVMDLSELANYQMTF